VEKDGRQTSALSDDWKTKSHWLLTATQMLSATIRTLWSVLPAQAPASNF